MKDIALKAQQSGVSGYRFLSQQDLRDLEPNLSRRVCAGLLVPGEAVIDPCLTPITMAHEACRLGAKVNPTLCQTLYMYTNI